MVGFHILVLVVLAVLAVGNQAGKCKGGFAALKGVEQVRIPQLGSAVLVQNGQTRVLVVLEREIALSGSIIRVLRAYADCSRRLPTSVRIARFSTANSAKPDYCLMVAIQFTNRFLGVQPEACERGQFFQNLCPELLGVFAAGVEVPCELVEIVPYFAALGKQSRDCFQCVLTALCDHYGVFDVHTAEDAANECGLGELKFFAALLDTQLFFCGHPELDDVRLSRRFAAVLLCVSVWTLHFSHI